MQSPGRVHFPGGCRVPREAGALPGLRCHGSRPMSCGARTCSCSQALEHQAEAWLVPVKGTSPPRARAGASPLPQACGTSPTAGMRIDRWSVWGWGSRATPSTAEPPPSEQILERALPCGGQARGPSTFPLKSLTAASSQPLPSIHAVSCYRGEYLPPE